MIENVYCIGGCLVFVNGEVVLIGIYVGIGVIGCVEIFVEYFCCYCYDVVCVVGFGCFFVECIEEEQLGFVVLYGCFCMLLFDGCLCLFGDVVDQFEFFGGLVVWCCVIEIEQCDYIVGFGDWYVDEGVGGDGFECGSVIVDMGVGFCVGVDYGFFVFQVFDVVVVVVKLQYVCQVENVWCVLVVCDGDGFGCGVDCVVVGLVYF